MTIQTVKPYIEAIEAYVSGKPIEEAARELGIDPAGIVFLASNENPLGMPESAKRALARVMEKGNRYPDGNALQFRTAAAEFFGVPLEWTIAGNGSDELLALIARLVLTPQTECVFSQYAFSVYELVARENGAKPVEIPACGFEVDLDAMAAAVNENTRLLFVTNPNNPTGLANTREQLEAFIAKIPEHCLVVLDEAYRDFLAPQMRFDSMDFVRRHPNVIVTRTLSKAYGLAGFRAGVAVAQPQWVEMLNRIRAPFNMNIYAQAAASAAIKDTDFLDRVYASNCAQRDRLQAFFDEQSIRYIPSQANFVLAQTGPQTRELIAGMFRRGVMVRSTASYGLPEWMRVSVGSEHDMDRFIEAFKQASAEL